METNQPMNGSQMTKSGITAKHVSLGLIVLVVLLIIVITLTGKNAQQPTSTSETTITQSQAEISPSQSISGLYNDPQNEFQFQYPPQVMVTNVSSDIISVSSTAGQVDSGDHDAHTVTGMQISIIEGNKVADQIDLAKDLFRNPTMKDLVINGVAAKELSGYGTGMLEGKFIKFVEIYKDGKTYEISYFEGEPNFPKGVSDQIISSFMFTK